MKTQIMITDSLRLLPALLWILSLGLTSCEDVIDLDLPSTDPQLVVEGWLTNEPVEQEVRLSLSAPYFENAELPGVSGALVVLFDGENPVDTFAERTDAAGFYASDYQLSAGGFYSVYILSPDGKEYQSQPQLLESVPAIDSIYAKFREESPFEDEGYYVFINTREPAGIGDHYRWRQYINGEFQNEPFDLNYASDEFVDGNPIIDFEVATAPAQVGDTVRIDQMTISREAFDYLQQVQQQTAFVGSLFDTPPAPIPGNFRNLNDPEDEPLGFLGVSGLTFAEIVIEEE